MDDLTSCDSVSPAVIHTGEAAFPSGDIEMATTRSDNGSDYGSDIELSEDLESILKAAESYSEIPVSPRPPEIAMQDIEDVVPQEENSVAPFRQFRKKGWLSVSDLVGTVWCEVQYDYRLRTLPYLPLNQRPEIIKTDKGKEIKVDKIKSQSKDRILKRGEEIHKRLEKEIHGEEEIRVETTSREEVWGLRFLHMFCCLEALIEVGTCRELPVVGYVGGTLVLGIIDELVRKPIPGETSNQPTDSPSKQSSITTFFTPTKPKPIPTYTPQSHKIYVSDSKTRASGTLPKESDTLAGRLQCMIYKELLDAMLLAGTSPSQPPTPSSSEDNWEVRNLLPSSGALSFHKIFEDLLIDPTLPFTSTFLTQAKEVILGNNIQFGAEYAMCLDDLLRIWYQYVEALGLGSGVVPPKKAGEVGVQLGRTEERLELVYRRAGRQKKKKSPSERGSKGKGKRKRPPRVSSAKPSNGEGAIVLQGSASIIMDSESQDASHAETLPTEAVASGIDELAAASLHNKASIHEDSGSDSEDKEDELGLSVQRDISTIEDVQAIPLRSSQPSQHTPTGSPTPSSPKSSPGTPIPDPNSQESTKSGSIIGKHRFQHDPTLLISHLNSVLQFWMGKRDPIGVSVVEANRCGWCEFEEGCEWRAQKAQEAWEKVRRGRQASGGS